MRNRDFSTRRNETRTLLEFICAIRVIREIRVVFCCCLGSYLARSPDDPITSEFPALIPLQSSLAAPHLHPDHLVP
jgi:hypothetical protein